MTEFPSPTAITSGPFFTPLKPRGANVAIERTRGIKMNEQIKLLDAALALHGNIPPPQRLSITQFCR